MTLYGDHDAFYRLDRADQVLVLGWWRARSLGGPAGVRDHYAQQAKPPVPFERLSTAEKFAACGIRLL